MQANNEKIIVAMSGGVDSAVTALILKNSYNNVACATMKICEHKEKFININNILNICSHLSMKCFIFNFKKQFENIVIKNFVDEYIIGNTPNPCIICNKFIKFGLLKNMAANFGYDKIATGHYSRIIKKNNRYLLLKAKDKKKDQSYFLYSLKQEILSSVVFPIGDLTKTEVREIALNNNLINAKKKESQDICFINKHKSYKDLIKKYHKDKIYCGDIVNFENKIIGKHQGLFNYTIGQKKGLNINSNKKIYVVKKDIKNNTIIVDESNFLYTNKLIASNINFIIFDCLKESMIVFAKIRATHNEAKAKIFPLSEDKVYVEFFENQRGITSGQSIVFYDNEYVIGGGIINAI